MKRPRIRVVKIGGSLLDCAALPRPLVHWLAQPDPNHGEAAGQRTARVDVLIAGGGALVDQIRQLDQRFSLDAETAHEISISAMSCTAQLLARLLNLERPIQSWDELQATLPARPCQAIVFDVQQWLAALEPHQPGVRLTHDWRSTSDSIAGRLARVLSADDLVLLKSTDIPPGNDWRGAAESGLVDPFFPQIAAELSSAAWINFRRLAQLPTQRT